MHKRKMKTFLMHPKLQKDHFGMHYKFNINKYFSKYRKYDIIVLAIRGEI